MNIKARTLVSALLSASMLAASGMAAAAATPEEAVRAAAEKVASAESATASVREKVEESIKSVKVAEEALAKARADKATAPERIKELKGQVKAAEAALGENKAAAKAAEKALARARDAEASAKKAAARAEAEAKVRAEREAAEKAAKEKKAAEKAQRKEKEAAEEKARGEAGDKRRQSAEALRKAKSELAEAEAREQRAMDDHDLALEAEAMREQLENAKGDLAKAQEAATAATARANAASAKLAAAQKALAEAKASKDVGNIKGAEAAVAQARGECDAANGESARAGRALKSAQAAVSGIKIPKALSVDEAKANLDKAFEERRIKSNAADEAFAKFADNNIRRMVSTRRKSISTVDQAVGYLARNCGDYTFVGDVIWLASTDVDGRPLCSAFANTRDVSAAIANATRRAVQGGFFFAGFKDNGQKDGKTEILVDKGRIGAINVSFFEDRNQERPTTNSNYSAAQIASMMGNGKVSRGASTNMVSNAFNFDDINERFSALNGHPDIAKANISFAPADGQFEYEREDGSKGQNGRAVTMDVNVTEEKMPVHFVFGIDNFGSVEGDDADAIGTDSWMAHATVQSLNLWGIGHILTVNGSSAFNGELWGASAAYMLPRMDNGKWWDWNWTFHGGYTKVDEEEAVSGRRADGSKYRLLDVDGEGYFGGLQISKRLVDTGRSTLDLSLGVTYRYVESGVEIWDADGGHQHYAYGHHTRNAAGVDDVDEGYYIVPASIALMYSETAIDSFGGRNYATVEGVHSLDTAGENRLKGFRYTIEGDDYWLARAQLARIQLLGDWNYSNASGLYSVFARADGQYTSDALVSAEQFAAGGHNSVRGYKERQFLGDSGASATVELRTPIYAGIFHRDAVAGTMPLDRWQFLAFADAGYFSLKDGKSANENDENLIYSIGAGFRLALGDHWQMRCDLGVPLEKKGSKDKSTGEKEEYDIDSCRLHLSLQAQW